MTISFFFELTVEDPYNRKNVYIEGVMFIFICMLYFLLSFLITHFIFETICRSYFVEKVAVMLKKLNKSAKDEIEIATAVGREVDIGLRDEIDERMEFLDVRMFPDQDGEDESHKPFKLSSITGEELFFRFDDYLRKKFGNLSLKLYKNYYNDSIASIVNPSVFIVIIILNMIASRYSSFIYFGIALIATNFDYNLKNSIFKF
jgi:hypothetical protein